MSVKELEGFRQRVLAYVYHIRETNLCKLLMHSFEKTGNVKEVNLTELRMILLEDQQNQGDADPVGQAIELLDKDPEAFLKTYFNESKPSGLRAVWSVTSQ
ncbi:MAG: hypothetical protein GZ094_04480 [Mariniphaga sp.]|nr:hypothetical protein [Mariniphaga sp.]